MTAGELEDLIARLVAKGVTVLLVTIGPGGELMGVGAGDDGPAPAAPGREETTRPDRPSLELGSDDTVCVPGEATEQTCTAPGNAGSPEKSDAPESSGATERTDAPERTGTSETTDASQNTGASGTADAPAASGQAPSGDGTRGTADSEGAAVKDEGTTAAATLGWGEPARTDDFTGGTDGWNIYDGPGHADTGPSPPLPS